MSDPVATLDDLLDADPFAAGIDERMTVAGDLLQARGDRRGELIVLEQAVAHATDRRVRIEQVAILRRWVHDHQAEVFGEAFARCSAKRGALKLETRGGRLRSLAIDVRRMPLGSGVEVPRVLAELLGAPGARWLVELRVRVATEAELSQVEAALALVEDRPPLELVIASTSTRPLAHNGANPVSARLLELLPRLWFATRAGRVASFDSAIHDDARVRIGRGLSSGREQTTRVACEALARLPGDAGQVFVPALQALLQPEVSPAAQWLIPALPTFGPWVAELVPQLATMSSCPRRWPQPVRSLAGQSLRALTARSQGTLAPE